MNASACFVLCLIVASPALAADAAVYDSDPAHPWNLLSAALQSDAPLRFYPPGQYEAVNLQGAAYDAARGALDDFLTHHGEKRITDPVKRALLQSELWATFDQVSDATGESQKERSEIARRCAVLIRRLALRDTEIAALPDTYAITVKSHAYPTAYDAAKRAQVFLPDDLLAEGRPWIMLGASAKEILQPAAIQHVKVAQGRAVFYALVRLPDGRPATLAYLKQLAEFPDPYVKNESYRDYPYARAAITLNPALPQFPAGTQVALFRRMLLIDTRGVPVVSPIVESLQLRVYAIDPQIAQPGELANQDFFELRLDRAELFEGGTKLLTSAGAGSRRHGVFDRATMFSQGSCNDCHGGAGIRSVNTYSHAFGSLPSSPWFEPSSEQRQDKNTLDWKKRDYTWGLLSGLLQSSR